MSGPAGTNQFVLLASVPIRLGREAEYLPVVDAVNDEMRREPTFVSTLLRRPHRADYEAKHPDLLRAPRAMEVFETLRAGHSEGAVR